MNTGPLECANPPTDEPAEVDLQLYRHRWRTVVSSCVAIAAVLLITPALIDLATGPLPRTSAPVLVGAGTPAERPVEVDGRPLECQLAPTQGMHKAFNCDGQRLTLRADAVEVSTEHALRRMHRAVEGGGTIAQDAQLLSDGEARVLVDLEAHRVSYAAPADVDGTRYILFASYPVTDATTDHEVLLDTLYREVTSQPVPSQWEFPALGVSPLAVSTGDSPDDADKEAEK
ncbi:hypothetical protein [Corynebacterium uterequi]|nr:hypothetical protein [Corynebacterium uterequi]